MEKMNENIISKVSNIVRLACYKQTNVFGHNIWEYHILPVVKYSKILATKFNIDIECAILSGYLHDYASVLDKKYYPDHHIYGAEFAEKILLEEGYPSNKILLIKESILNHRGSLQNTAESLYITCLSSADAMAHISEVPSLLYLAYHENNKSVDEGRRWVLEKINRSWNKLCPEAKEVIYDKYQALQTILKEE